MTTAIFKVIIFFGMWAMAVYALATYVLKDNVIIIPGLLIGAVVALFFLKKAKSEERIKNLKK